MRPARDPVECRLYGILDLACLDGRDPAGVASRMIEGGVDILQVRAKNAPPARAAAMARAVLRVSRPARVPLIVNDHPSVAADVGAQGIHIGQEDGHVSAARRIAGPDCWIGKSTHSLAQALAAEEEGADYIGVGPIFATPTKPNYTPVGLDLVREVKARIQIPFFCIGGLKLENAAEVLRAGATRIVVVTGILDAPDITARCREFRGLLDAS